jgi:hypothetical protein
VIPWLTSDVAGQCGSCWAFGTGGSFADRLCIASNASKVAAPASLALHSALSRHQLTRAKVLDDGASYQEIIACDKIPPNNGCKGGVPRLVWDWAEAFSVASNSCFMCTAACSSRTEFL